LQAFRLRAIAQGAKEAKEEIAKAQLDREFKEFRECKEFKESATDIYP